METSRGNNPSVQCRLCGFFGHHKIDIIGNNSRLEYLDRKELCDKIFRCVDVRVEISDVTTKICEQCFCNVNNYDLFRDICATTDRKMQKSKRSRSGIGEPNGMRGLGCQMGHSSQEIISQNGPSSDNQPTECIILTDDETDAENDEIKRSELQVASIEDTSPVGDAVAASERAKTEMASNVLDAEIPNEPNPEPAANTTQELAATCTSLPIRDELKLPVCGNGELPACEQVANEDGQQFKISNVALSSAKHPQRRDTSNNSLGDCVLLIDEETDFGEGIRIRKGKHSIKAGKRTKAVRDEPAFVVKCRGAKGCSEMFESWEAMMLHKTAYHAKEIQPNFNCHLCKKWITSKRSLKQHMVAVHIGLKPFKCPFPMCSMEFADKSSLQRHTNSIHTKKVAFKCRKCHRKFYQKGNLTTHLASKHGEGITFSCLVCEKLFYGKQSFQKHLDAVHIGLKPSKCPFSMCLKAFDKKEHLQRHTNSIHSEKIVFNCAKCGMKFYRKDILKRHLALKH